MSLQVITPVSTQEQTKWAQIALDEYISLSGESEDEAIASLLKSLMLLCERDSEFVGDFDQELERAKHNFLRKS